MNPSHAWICERLVNKAKDLTDFLPPEERKEALYHAIQALKEFASGFTMVEPVIVLGED